VFCYALSRSRPRPAILFTISLSDRERFGRFFVHAIEASSLLEKFSVTSKLNNYPALLEYLFDLGRQTADTWFASHGAAIGGSTVDLQRLLPED
jgi:hypothetical protein